MTEKYTTDDLLSASFNKKPLEFNQIFGDIILDKIRDAVENKKIEIAKNMYNYQPEDQSDEDEQYFEPEEEYKEEELNDEEA